MSNDNFEALVQRDRAHGSIYTSQTVFRAEMERIFHRAWLCVGHESEVPEAGQFRVTKLGTQSVIMVRGEDGHVRVLMNRCRHRGLTLTEEECGKKRGFTCPYHGWAFSSQGDLLAIPERDGYPPDLQLKDFGMTPAPRVGAYRGLVFASLQATGPTLDEHLGKAKPYIDLFFDMSPTGQVNANQGITKTVYNGNWKFVGMDGYHPHVVHQTYFATVRRRRAAQGVHKGSDSFKDASGNVARDLGNGHVLLDVFPERSCEYASWLTTKLDQEGWREYYDAMITAHGKARCDEVLTWEGDPHIGVFPNLQLIQSQIRIIRPIAADRTEILMLPTALQNVPESVNQQRLRRHELFYGAASQGSPDDAEVFERNQEGLSAEVDPWVYLARGLHRERVEPDGTIVGHITDETTQRGQLRQWKVFMADHPQTNTYIQSKEIQRAVVE